ncbi:MAG: 3-hexulose-6-phosphate synthase [Candidatus Latescibacterota bacterium]
MKLQLALDLIDIDGAKRFLEDVIDLVDIVEIGTPFLLLEGAKAITEIKRAYPLVTVLADTKIADAGDHEAKIAFEAGADIVTVLGAAHDATIRLAVGQAQTSGKKVLIDLIAVEKVEKRALELDGLGVDYVCVHTAFDIQASGADPLQELQLVHPVLNHAGMAVAGGVNPETLSRIASYDPEIVVVGGFITGNPHPRRAAKAIRALLEGREWGR